MGDGDFRDVSELNWGEGGLDDRCMVQRLSVPPNTLLIESRLSLPQNTAGTGQRKLFKLPENVCFRADLLFQHFRRCGVGGGWQSWSFW